MDKNILESYIRDGLSSYEISKKQGKSPTTVAYWLKKYNLKTNYVYKSGDGFDKSRKNKNVNRIKEMNWDKIQKYYDNGMMWRDLVKEFKTSSATLNKARKLGLWKTRTSQESLKLSKTNRKPRKHTQETKKRLSKSRKDYLASIGKHAWNVHTYFNSAPCQKLKDELKTKGLIFQEEYQALRHIKRFFAIDIAFPDIKLGIEINGRQHYDSDNKLLPYYQNRHDLITMNGWELIEIPYSKIFDEDYKNNLIKYIETKLVVLPGIAPGHGSHLER